MPLSVKYFGQLIADAINFEKTSIEKVLEVLKDNSEEHADLNFKIVVEVAKESVTLGGNGPEIVKKIDFSSFTSNTKLLDSIKTDAILKSVL